MQENTVRYSEGKRVTLFSVWINISLIILKLFAGIFGRSSAIIADAVHSTSDLVTDIVVIVGLKYSTKPGDKQHPYGHEKIETLVSLVLGIFLVGVGIKIGYNGGKTVFFNSPTNPTIIALAAALTSLTVKEILYRYTLFIGERINSKSIIANAWHHRTDALSSLVAMVGIAGNMMGVKMLDPVAAIFIAFFIVKTGVRIIKDTSSELIESSISKELTKKMKEIASRTEGVLGVHNIRARYIGSSIFVEIHIEVAGNIKVKEGHFIADEVERKIMENITQVREVLVHVDPYFPKNKNKSARK